MQPIILMRHQVKALIAFNFLSLLLPCGTKPDFSLGDYLWVREGFQDSPHFGLIYQASYDDVPPSREFLPKVWAHGGWRDPAEMREHQSRLRVHVSASCLEIKSLELSPWEILTTGISFLASADQVSKYVGSGIFDRYVLALSQGAYFEGTV